MEDLSVKKPSLARKQKKSLAKITERRLRKTNWFDTRGDVQLESINTLSGCSILFTKNIAHALFPNKKSQKSISSSCDWLSFVILNIQTESAQRKRVSESKNNDLTQLLRRIDDESLEEELATRKHFVLDSELENGRHRVFHFAMEILDAHILSQKLDTVLKVLKCAANLNFAFGFVLKNIELGTCRYY